MVVTAQDVSALRKRTGAGMMDCKKALIEAEGNLENAIDLLRQKGQKVVADRASRDATEGAVFASTTPDNRQAFLLVLSCETDFVAKSELFLTLGKSILEAAVTHQPTTAVELRALSLGNQSVEEAIVAATGAIGEKITISYYESLAAQLTVAYIHAGNRLAVLVGLSGSQGDAVIDAGRDVAMQIAAMSPIAVDKDQIDSSVLEKERAIIRQQVMDESHDSIKAEKVTQGRLCKFFQENTLLEQPFVKNNKLTVRQYLQTIAPSLTVIAFKRIGVGC